jgi:hypothetical protein
MHGNAAPPPIPNETDASSCSRGKSTRAARQISRLNAVALSIKVRTAVGTGSISIPALGSAKKISSAKVTAGVARIMLR